MDKVKSAVNGIKPYVLTVFYTLVALAIMFLWVHRSGFYKFIKYADLYDKLEFQADYQLKK